MFRYHLPLIYIPVPGGDLPDVNVPVRAGGRDHGSVRRPVALEQVLLEVVRVSLQHLHTSLAHTVRPHILVQGTCFIGTGTRGAPDLEALDPKVKGPPGSVIICTDPDPAIKKQKQLRKPLTSTVL
jgi:hypothetical protein